MENVTVKATKSSMNTKDTQFKGSDESTDEAANLQPEPYGGLETHNPDIDVRKAGPEHKGPFKQPHGIHTDEQGNLESHEPPTNPRGPNTEVKTGSIDNEQGDQLK